MSSWHKCYYIGWQFLLNHCLAFTSLFYIEYKHNRDQIFVPCAWKYCILLMWFLTLIYWSSEIINTWATIQQSKGLILRRQSIAFSWNDSFLPLSQNEVPLLGCHQSQPEGVSVANVHGDTTWTDISFPNTQNFKIRNKLFRLSGHFRMRTVFSVSFIPVLSIQNSLVPNTQQMSILLSLLLFLNHTFVLA